MKQTRLTDFLLCAALAAVPATGMAADAVLGGYVSYNTAEKLGWYDMDSKGELTFRWVDELASARSYPMVFGWERDGLVCGVSSLLADRILYNYDYVEIDPATGEYLAKNPVSVRNDDGTANYLNYYHTAAYDPVSDRVYGYGYNAAGDAFVFKSSAYDMTDTKIIRVVADSEYCASLTWNQDEQRLVGFNRVSFVYIDPATGVQTEVYKEPVADYQYSYTGLVYDPRERGYYWNYFTKDNVSHMALVDLTAKTIKEVRTFPDRTNFRFMVTRGEMVSPNAPGQVEFKSLDFDKDALSGKVCFRLPSKANNGNALTGKLGWKLMCDGVQAASGEAEPGAEVAAQVSVAAAGEHLFSMTCSAGDFESLAVTELKYVGLDNPAAPADVTLSDSRLTWQAVTAGAHGGYVDPAAIRYSVTFNDQSLGETASTSMDIPFPTGKEYACYRATVVAVNGAGGSAASASNEVKYGSPLSLPRTFVPDQLTTPLFTMQDCDGDGAGWTYNNGARGQELFISGYSENGPADDWFFLPPLDCSDASKTYSISVNAALNAASDKPISIEICAGKQAEASAMNTVIVPLTPVTNASLKEYRGLFTLSGELAGAQGVVIGVRAYAPDGDAVLKARRFKVEKTSVSPQAPAFPSDITVTAAAKGELKTHVEFTMPDKCVDGSDIGASETLSVVIFDDSKVTVTGKPGEKMSATVDAYQGINEVEITPALGSLKGDKRTYEVYCGKDIPTYVRNMSIDITDSNLEAYLYWDAPTEGLNGGYVDESELVYWLCSYDGSTGSYTPYAELGKEPEYVMQLKEGDKLGTYQFAIQARSSAGASPDYYPVRVQLGTPYNLNIIENFTNSMGDPAINFKPLTAISTGDYANTNWRVMNPAEVDGKYALRSNVGIVATCDNAPSKGLLMLPKFSTAGLGTIRVVLEFYRSDENPVCNLLAQASGMNEFMVAGTLESEGEGYQRQTIILPADFEDCGWVGLELETSYANIFQTFVLSSYRILGSDPAGADVVLASSEYIARGGNGCLEVCGPADTEAAVYSLDGRRIAAFTLSGSTDRVNVSAGIYVVRMGDKTLKVLVY